MTTRAVRILVVDEEEPITHLLSLALGMEGWEVRVAGTAAAALEQVGSFAPDIMLLDMMLPDAIGTTVVARLREDGVTTPVVFLTGRASLEDRIAGYAAGGDEYLTKPFALEEVVEKLQPIVRRLGLAPTSTTYADLVLDEATSEVWRGDERVLLTPIEFEMLHALVVEPEEPHTLGQVLRAITVRGMRVPRDIAVRMLERMRQLVNGSSTPLVYVDDAGWRLAVA